MASETASGLHLPTAVQRAVTGFVETLATGLGANLQAVLVYGSAVRGPWRPGRSDVNLLVVVEDAGVETLASVKAATRRHRRAPLTPVVVTRDDLLAAAVAAPAILWDIRQHHHLAYGADPLAELTLTIGDLRRQLRWELRDKLHRLRSLFLGADDHRRLEALMAESFGSFVCLLRHLLRGESGEDGGDPVQVIGEASRRLGLELRTLQALYALRYEGVRLEAGRATGLFDAYLAAVQAAAEAAERLAGEPQPAPVAPSSEPLPAALTEQPTEPVSEPVSETAAPVAAEAAPDAVEPESVEEQVVTAPADDEIETTATATEETPGEVAEPVVEPAEPAVDASPTTTDDSAEPVEAEAGSEDGP